MYEKKAFRRLHLTPAFKTEVTLVLGGKTLQKKVKPKHPSNLLSKGITSFFKVV